MRFFTHSMSGKLKKRKDNDEGHTSYPRPQNDPVTIPIIQWCGEEVQMTRCPHPTLISRMSHLYICILLFFYCYLIIHGVAELQNFSYINKKYGWTFGLVYIYSDLIFRGIYLHHWMI